MAIEFEFDGKKYRFMGEYRYPKNGECFLSGTGKILKDGEGPNNAQGARAIVEEVKVQHEFGGIVFEETGEERTLTYNEWGVYTPTGEIYNHRRMEHSLTCSYLPLRPVEIV